MNVLQDKVVEAKDENGPYFSNMIIISSHGHDYNEECYMPKYEHFGYKIKLVRDIHQPMFSMEVVKPALIGKSMQKLHQWEKIMRQIKKSYNKYAQGSILDKWDKYNEETRAKPMA